MGPSTKVLTTILVKKNPNPNSMTSSSKTKDFQPFLRLTMHRHELLSGISCPSFLLPNSSLCRYSHWIQLRLQVFFHLQHSVTISSPYRNILEQKFPKLLYISLLLLFPSLRIAKHYESPLGFPGLFSFGLYKNWAMSPLSRREDDSQDELLQQR